ncbi:MAG: bifunctional phosphoribosylaminoimidazolecarboxamide formyltransferase/IMP cyclohydrolase PurH [Candidatus Schekmanbacteria bacterium]|nr:MAG: bifunctional phosphoribosylaminoimidazolecarboxamide formyltransferase/IMP cyclohydrolase PurH [Candidatus Schekmanbacteria bacterium]
MKVKRALISVSDKTGIVEFAKGLNELGIEIISTGGTAKKINESGIDVIEISDFTGFPEMLSGRVKTLHPYVHGGILALRDDEKHKKEVEEHQIKYIDMVIVNLYPFESTITKEDCKLSEAVENIDIGGPTMIRSAAKNHKYVAVVVNPADYESVLEELKQNNGELSERTCFDLAAKAFSHTARYDCVISNYFNPQKSTASEEVFAEEFGIGVEKIQNLRYGENPHQKAAFYRVSGEKGGIADIRQLHGKELSFNNIVDVDGALAVVLEFDEIAVAIIKHTNPCGAAVSKVSVKDAYMKALATDPVSAFGSIIAVNREVDGDAAEEISKLFVEAIIAPSFSEEALKILTKKKNIRLLTIDYDRAKKERASMPDIKRVLGGLVIQERDVHQIDRNNVKIPTKRQPTNDEFEGLMFAWKIVKNVKSNAIVFTNKEQTVGVGAGQMSRVDSVKIARMKANLPTKGCVMASDAFFPFRDGIDAAAEAGITAVIQPGGSVRDEEVIKACDEHDIAMVFTGIRHFKH